MNQNLEGPNMENGYYFHLPRNSISHFSETTTFNSSLINSVVNSILEREFWFRSSFRLILVWHGWHYGKSNVCYFLLSSSMPKPNLLRIYRFDFFVEKLNRFSQICMRGFDWNSFKYGPCFKILIHPKNQKLLVMKSYLDIDSHSYRSVQAWFLLWKSHGKSLVLCWRLRLSSFPLWSLHPNFDSPMCQKILSIKNSVVQCFNQRSLFWWRYFGQ